jgi:hypothetical protein
MFIKPITDVTTLNNKDVIPSEMDNLIGSKIGSKLIIEYMGMKLNGRKK